MNVLLSIINANIHHCSKHKHSCWELVYRLVGSSDTTIGDRTYRISKGDLYLIPPNVFHEDSAKEPFSDSVIQIDDLPFIDTIVLQDVDSLIQSFFQIINYVMNKKDNNYNVVANSLAVAFLQHLNTYSLISKPFIHKLKDIMYRNISNPDFNLTKEIKDMNYNPDYIRRCFKSETQKTPLSYLTDLRLHHAKQLLVMPTYESIEIISEKCGFHDSFYFSTYFKKHTGLSPLQYRKINLSKGNL